MDAETRTTLRILAVIVLAVASVLAWWTVRQARRPHLLDVSVVFRGENERTASGAFRFLPAGARIEVGALITYRRGNGEPRRICGLTPVEVNGTLLDVEPPSAWPSSGGELRAFWYTVEPSLLGWQAVGPESADKLEYKDFLVQSLGRGLVTELDLEAHNDDFLARKVTGNSLPGGTFRLKVRVGSYASEGDLIAAESVSSPGAAALLDGTVPSIAVLLPLPAGVDPALSRLVRLGCFTFRPEVWPEVGGWPLPLSPGRLASEGYLTTPAGFASAAAGGTPLDRPWRAAVELVEAGTGWRLKHSGRAVEWGTDVAAGDSLRSGERYFVLLEDDGDGALSLADTVIYAWGEPARIAPLGLAAGAEGADLELLRRAL